MAQCQKFLDEFESLSEDDATQFNHLKSDIVNVIEDGDDDPELLLMLANVHAMLCEYEAAVISLHQYLQVYPNDRKARNKLNTFIELNEKRKRAKLSIKEIEDLKDYLDEQLSIIACNHTFQHVIKWLLNSDQTEIQAIIDWLEIEGCYCDCEVVMNL